MLEFASLLAAMIWIFYRYLQTLNQLHLEWTLLAVFFGVFWCLTHKVYLTFVFLFFVSAILLHQCLVVLSSSVNWLKQETSAESTIMLNGRIQQRILKEDTVRLQVSSLELSEGEKNCDFQKEFYTFLRKSVEFLIFIGDFNYRL